MKRSRRYHQTRQAWVEAMRGVSCGSGAEGIDAFCHADETFVFPANPFIIKELKEKMGEEEAKNKKTEQTSTKDNNRGGNEGSSGLTKQRHLSRVRITG